MRRKRNSRNKDIVILISVDDLEEVLLYVISEILGEIFSQQEEYPVAPMEQKRSEAEELITSSDASRLLRVTPATIDRLVRTNRLHRIKFEGKVFFKRSEVVNLLLGGRYGHGLPK